MKSKKKKCNNSLKEQEKNEVPKYDKAKWKNIIDTTQSNYANMIKRLDKSQKMSNFVLIYYSIFLIVNTLTGKYFPEYFNLKVSEYFGVILSIIVLAYSIINNSANYSIRISRIEESLNKLKTIKRNLETSELEKCVDEYNKITDNTERRSDVDFFITVKHLCNEFGISWITKKKKKEKKEKQEKQEKQMETNTNISGEEDKKQKQIVNNYISEINVWLEEGKIICQNIWYVVLVLVPIVIFTMCVVAQGSGNF